MLAEHFDAEGDADYDGNDGSKRLESFCVADSSLSVVAELKRPGDLIGLDELKQLTRYADYLRSERKRSRTIHRTPTVKSRDASCTGGSGPTCCGGREATVAKRWDLSGDMGQIARGCGVAHTANTRRL